MGKMTEIRWHGRGGQGTVTAAKVLAETAITGGSYVQAFPEYGPERMGAPLRAFNRISDHELSVHCQVTNPDVVVVVDSTLLKAVDITEGTDGKGLFLINSPEAAEKLKKEYSMEGKGVYTVNATKISLECLGRPMPNTPLLGALARITDIIDIETLIDDVTRNFSKKFSSQIVNANIASIRKAYEEVTGE
ncbi:MAG: 2-oxoacid:acceptor oxidoreductase family protein [bacterium]